MAHYDKITEGYEKATKRPLREYAYRPTLDYFLGKAVQNKKVIDFACGEGISSRIIKELGATEVIGVDESYKQIEKAKEKDPSRKYYVGNAVDFKYKKQNYFEIATAILFTTYLPNEETLNKFFKNVSQHLKKGGEFYAMVPDLDSMKEDYESYGISIKKNKRNDNSRDFTIKDFKENIFCEATLYYIPKSSYKFLLEKNGFEPTWHKGVLSPTAIDLMGKKFWQEYLDNPVYYMIKAKKK